MPEDEGAIPARERLSEAEEVRLLQSELRRARQHKRKDYASELAPKLAALARQYRKDNPGCNQQDLHDSLKFARNLC